MDPRAWRRFRKNKGAIVGALLVLFVTLTAFLGPLAAPKDPDLQYSEGLDATTGLPVAANAQFRMGADQLGRDELSRLLHGGRVSMQVAFGATALAVFVGLAIGVATGFFGGVFDTATMRLVDVLLSMPFLLIVIVINQVFDSPSLAVLYVLLGLLSWTTLARVTRAKTMQVRELEFVQAARALGMSRSRIVVRHVLPNVIQPAIILGSTLVAQIIIVESAMSFLGLGVRPPTSSWGTMLHDGVGFISNAPRLVLLPGALIVAAVFGFNLLGEGLRDALDPKS
ncbi:MAG: ABC transporter permease [Sandaracinaceae bacterium]|nr:ABC transporter permease [Sandaracinaceae bacterium]